MSAPNAAGTASTRPVPVVCCTCNHAWKADLRPRQPTNHLGCPYCQARDVVRASRTRAILVTVH